MFRYNIYDSSSVSLDNFEIRFISIHTRVDLKVSGLTYKSRDKRKMLRRIYSAIYGEVNVSVSICVDIKGDYIEK